MDVVWLRHLAYVLMPALTVLWGESLRARFLHRGARRAIRLLLAALLAWQSVRLLKSTWPSRLCWMRMRHC